MSVVGQIGRMAPDYAPNPEAALRDMTIKPPIRATIEAEAEKLGLSLADEPKTARYDLKTHRQVTSLRGASREIYLVQIPDWIADDGSYAARVDDTRFAFAGAVVRFCAEDVDAPCAGLERLFDDWKEDKKIDARFVAWRRFDELAKGFGLGSQLRLEEEWLKPEADVDQWAGSGDGTESSDSGADAPSGPRLIQLFLASSSELKQDRDAVQIWAARENNKLFKRGVRLQVNLWEDFLDAVAPTGLQDRYNARVRQSDIVLCLFATKAGKYTEEEFDAALTSMQETGKPRYIFTYFKDVQVSVGDREAFENLQSLHAFKEKLRKLEHYPTDYKNTDHLRYQLTNQLDKILEEMGVPKG